MSNQSQQKVGGKCGRTRRVPPVVRGFAFAAGSACLALSIHAPPGIALAGEEVASPASRNPATTLLFSLREARSELVRFGELAEFLALEDVPKEARTLERLRDMATPLVGASLAKGDFESGERIFRHAVALAEDHKARGEWPQTMLTSWTFPSALLRSMVHESLGGGLERIAFQQFVVARDGGATIKPSHDLGRLGEGFYRVYEDAGGNARVHEALDALAAQLHERCREGYPELLGIYWIDFLPRLPAEAHAEAVAWADARAAEADRPWAALAREFAVAGRLGLARSVVPERRALLEGMPDPDAYRPHYLAMVRNEALPLAVRVAIARRLAAGSRPGLLGPEIATAAAEALAEALETDAPNSSPACREIVREFTLHQGSLEWEALASRLQAAWVHANRSNSADRRTETGFWPDPGAVLEMLRLATRLPGPDPAAAILADGHAKEQLERSAAALFLLVESGHHDAAAALLPTGIDWMDISEDYLPNGRIDVRYTGRVHDRLPAFLAGIEDSAARYLAELLVVGAPDLPPDEAEPDAGYPSRGQRLREAALRFAEVDFDGSPDGAHLRTRVFEQLAAFDGPAQEVLDEWLRDYTPEMAQTLCALRNPKHAEHAALPFATFAALRLRRNEIDGVADFVEAVNRGRGSVEVRRTALEHFSLRFLRAFAHHWPQATPEELDRWTEAFDLLLTGPVDELARHPQLSRLVATHLAATLLAEGDVDGQGWLAALDARRAALVAEAVRDRSQDFLDGLQAALKYRASHPVDRASPARRARATLLAFSNPSIQEGFGKANPTLFNRLRLMGHLETEQLLAGPGRLLVEAYPRGGWAAAELAALAVEAGDLETALAWSARSLADCGPPAEAPDRYARLAAEKAQILLDADRPTEALQCLETLDPELDPTALGPVAAAALHRARKRAESATDGEGKAEGGRDG